MTRVDPASGCCASGTSTRRARTSRATTRSCSPRCSPASASSSSPTTSTKAASPTRSPSATAGCARRAGSSAYDDVPLDRGRRGAAPRDRRRGAAVRRHLLRSPAPRAGARRPVERARRRLGGRRAGVRDRRAAALHGSAARTRIALIASHQDQVVDVPPDARVIASATSGYCPVAGLAVGERAWTLQRHPEFVPDLADHLLAGPRRAHRRRAGRAVPRASLDAAARPRTVARWIANFFVD